MALRFDGCAHEDDDFVMMCAGGSGQTSQGGCSSTRKPTANDRIEMHEEHMLMRAFVYECVRVEERVWPIDKKWGGGPF